jgi:hypothetical protein
MVYFQTKNQILVNLEGLGVENVVIFYHHLEYLSPIWYTFGIAIWYSLRPFGIFLPFWYLWTRKNLATLT